MLTESILQMYSKTREDRAYFGISSISPCPKKTYLNLLNHLRKVNNPPKVVTQEETDPQQLMLMDDGHYQEAQIVDLLRRAGYEVTYTGKEQAEVHIGKSHIPGHPDGFVNQTWMLEVKARSYNTYLKFCQLGLAAFPDIRTQVQLYMSAEDLPYPIKSCRVMFKHKETTSLKDIEEVPDPEYAGQITEDTDSIIQDGWIPQSELSELCIGCRWAETCWGGEVVDFSGFQYLSLPQVESKWIRGDFHYSLGKSLKDEAEAELLTKMSPTAEELLTDRLRITRTSSTSPRFSKKRFLKDHNELEYLQYCDLVDKVTVRVKEI